MGDGEETYNEFYRWFSGLSESEAAEYTTKYPEPDEWAGRLALIRAHPWK
jgi:hypothetical protein